jgi:CRP-like cAMP-binding protein
VGEVRAGGFVGERGLVTNEPRNATVITRERTVSYVLRRARLQEYFGHIAPFIEHIRSIFGGTSEPSTPRERGS